MTTMEDQLKCFYLNASSQNASDMLRTCVQDKTSSFEFNCKDDPMEQELPNDVKNIARINNISIQRGIIDNNVIEGFTGKMFITDNGPGKSSVPEGECPEGFSLCKITGKCIQKCQNCIYRDNMKSQQFNEGDPCFPNGVYNGITNEGYIKCTCGNNNQHCSDNFIQQLFTTDGIFINHKKINTNIGNSQHIESLFNIDYL